MTPDHALAVLGLDRSADWRAIRAQHRARIRAVHPDVGGDDRRAADLNEALAVLARETGEGDHPLSPSHPSHPSPPPAPTPRPAAPAPPAVAVDADRTLRIDVAPSELLMRLADAGHRIGEVVFVDPLAGLVEIVVGTGTSTAQLAVSVGDPGADGVPVAFTLEPLGRGTSPPIDDVVDALAAAVRDGR